MSLHAHAQATMSRCVRSCAEPWYAARRYSPRTRVDDVCQLRQQSLSWIYIRRRHTRLLRYPAWKTSSQSRAISWDISTISERASRSSWQFAAEAALVFGSAGPEACSFSERMATSAIRVSDMRAIEQIRTLTIVRAPKTYVGAGNAGSPESLQQSFDGLAQRRP